MENKDYLKQKAREWAEVNNPEMLEASINGFMAGVNFYAEYLKNQENE